MLMERGEEKGKRYRSIIRYVARIFSMSWPISVDEQNTNPVRSWGQDIGGYNVKLNKVRCVQFRQNKTFIFLSIHFSTKFKKGHFHFPSNQEMYILVIIIKKKKKMIMIGGTYFVIFIWNIGNNYYFIIQVSIL